ncbi:MAG: hypothetical protein ACK5SJ_14070, partial [Bacteroidota bacterium]|nr:hypothetical protein [Flammeovirgaceae bacterium]
FSEQAGFVLKKKRKAMSKLLSFFFREIKKKVSISYFSICCVRNLRPPIDFIQKKYKISNGEKYPVTGGKYPLQKKLSTVDICFRPA